ncbi:MAG: M16 family metallopeptidase [Janthinobacterium lividum]
MTQKNSFLLFIAFCWFAIVAPQSHAAIKIREVQANNGLKAWFVEDHSIPVIALQISFKAGYAYAPASKAGLVNLLAHMMDEGAGPYTSQEFIERLQKRAIHLNFSCDVDTFKISLKTTKEHFQEALELLKYTLTQARFDPREFEKIRASFLTTLKIQEKTPRYLANKTFNEIMLGSHPYGQLRLGTSETLKSLTPQDLKDFAKAGFARDGLTVGACGDVTSDQLKAMLETIFQELPQQSRLTPLPAFVLPSEAQTKIVQANFPQSHVIFAQQGLTPRDPDFIKLSLLSQILGGSFDSTLFSEIRIKRGNAYYISTSLDNSDQASFFAGRFGGDNAHVLESVKLIQDIWQQTKDKGVRAENLADAKSYILGSYDVNLDSSQRIASLTHYYQLWGYPIDYPEKRVKLIQDITLDQLNAFAQKFLTPSHLTFVIVG